MKHKNTAMELAKAIWSYADETLADDEQVIRMITRMIREWQRANTEGKV